MTYDIFISNREGETRLVQNAPDKVTAQRIVYSRNHAEAEIAARCRAPVPCFSWSYSEHDHITDGEIATGTQ